MTDKIKMVEDSDLDEDNKKLLKLSEIPWREYLAEKGYVDDGIENMCSACIKKQVEDHGKQVIPCKGLLTAETQLGDDLYKAIIEKSTPEEIEVLHSMYDPYAFMDNNVDLERKGKPNRKFSSRWYQERVVKCLSEDTDILMGDGSYKKIKDVEVDDKVVSYNETRRSAPVNKVLNKWYSGEKEVFLITLENGDTLEATEDHPILAWVQKGVLNPLLQCPSFKTDYVSIKDGLKVGMDVYTLNASPVFGKESDLRLAKMLGYLITDGYINLKNTKVEFTNTNWDYVNEFKVCAEALGNKVSFYTKPAKGLRKEAYTVKVLSNKGTSPFYKFLRSINALDKNSKEKSIFDFVLNQGSLEFVSNFLNRAYAGDGCVYVNPDKNSGKLSIHSCYDSYMIKNWYKLLRKVGVQSINTYKYQREAGSSSSVISQADSIKTFFNLVGPIFGKEKKSLELEQKLSNIQSCSRRGTFRTSSRTKIISIESVGVKPTYDIEVDKRHNFIANNIIVHNCSAKSKVVRMGRRTGKTYAMAVLILHKVLTNKNYRVLLVSPYAAQTEEVVENIKALCSMLPENPIVSSKGSPIHVVTFNTGSILKGFTASTDANSVRGQPGHLLVLDECLVGDTEILTKEGLKPLSGVVIGDQVLSEEGTYQAVLNKQMTGVKQVSSYYYDNGIVLKGTSNHPVKTPTGFEEISSALLVQVEPKENYQQSSNDEIIARLLGYNHGDGWLYRDTVGFSGDILGLEKIKKDINILYPSKWAMTTSSRDTCSPKYNIVGKTSSFVAGKELHDLFKSHGFITTGNKVNNYTPVPNFIKEGSLSVKAEYLAGLFGAEGLKPTYASRGYIGKVISLSQHKDYEHIEDLKEFMNTLVTFLSELGVQASVYTPILTQSGTYRSVLNVHNTLENLIAFYEKVGYRYCQEKEDLAHQALQHLYFLKRKTIEREELIKSLKTSRKEGVSYKTLQTLYSLTQSQIYELVHKCKGSFTRSIENSFKNWKESHVINGRVFTRISKVREEGFQEVYNLTVDNTHTYVANGLLTHNCDDIPEKAMISIMGIKMDNKDVEVWRSGTPKGELNLHHAEKDPTTKAFHYPSFVIPHYDDQLDAELREDLGEIGFVQETMAEFGLVSNGVFQTLFIQRAQQRAVFVRAEDVLADRRRFIVTIGVDWNHDQVGTRIVVIAYDKMNPQFSIIEKEAVAIVGYTQQAAMEKIIHLNRKYNADHIFCDEGFGVTQIGDLKRVGEAAAGKVPQGHPDLKLLDIQAVNFSSNTEIRDPVSGEMYKTPTKQFAVSNTVLMLERDMISLHPKEDNDIILQMKNYIEKSRNKGKIVYSYLSKKIGDHDLDALMIGLYGYRKIYSSLFEGSVFQAMIKFADKNDPEQQNTGGILPVQDDLLTSSGIVPLRFSSRSGINNSARVVSLGGASRRRNHFK